MGSQSKIDESPLREEILADMVRGMSDSKVAAKYGFHRSTLVRYRKRMAGPIRQSSQEAYREAVGKMGNALIDKVKDLDIIHDGIRDLLVEDGKLKKIVSVMQIATFRDNVQLLLKAQETYGKQLDRLESYGFGIAQSKDNEDMDTQMDSLIDVVLRALEPYEEAKQAVVDAVKQCGRQVPE